MTTHPKCERQNTRAYAYVISRIFQMFTPHTNQSINESFYLCCLVQYLSLRRGRGREYSEHNSGFLDQKAGRKEKKKKRKKKKERRSCQKNDFQERQWKSL